MSMWQQVKSWEATILLEAYMKQSQINKVLLLQLFTRKQDGSFSVL